MAEQENRLFLLDGMALVYRAFYALINAPIMTSRGFNTSAIYGFTNTLLDIKKKWQPTHLAVAFDTSDPTERHIEYPEYKANRDAMPEELSESIPHVLRMIDAFNVPVLRYPGYEADDVIGTLAKQASEKAFQTYMVTPDKDFAQLVDEHVRIYKPGRRGGDVEILGPNEILEKWGIESIDQVRDILGLMGDKSDNVPGIPGIGEKTAQKLIAQFGSIETLVDSTDQLKGKQKERVEEHRELALLSKRLVTINCAVPVEVGLDDLVVREQDDEKLAVLMGEFEFRTLSKRVLGADFSKSMPAPRQPDLFDLGGGREAAPQSSEEEEAPRVPLKKLADVPHRYRLIDSDDALAVLLKDLSKQRHFCFDVETMQRNAKGADLVGIAFSWQAGQAAFVPFPETRLEATTFLESLRPIFENPKVGKIGHNLHFDITVLHWYGVSVRGPLFDTMLASYVCNPAGRHRMDSLADVLLEYQCISYQEALGIHANLREIPIEKLVDYACEDADITLQIRDKLAPVLKERNAERVMFEVETPLIPVLVEMEAEGIHLDEDAVREYASDLETDAKALQEKVFELAGMQFNLDSPKQLGDVLFEHMKLDPKAKRTQKSGQYATSENLLLGLAEKHEVVRCVLDYRTCQKLLSTYIYMLPETVREDTGRVHTTYNQAVAATGRMQSANPNLQNIPVRTERGREVRKAFVARNDDYVLLSADYSQIELRIAAELSGDEALTDAFVRELDVHQATAARVYDVAPEDVDPDMRRKAKMVNFGIIYGISAFGLSQRLGIPRKEANMIISQYFAKYPGVRDYMDRTIEFCREHGYVETLTGRRRYLPDINSRNHSLRSAAERNAINSPVQGSAADMIKLAMIKIQDRMRDSNFRSRMLLQVHDELVFDLHYSERHSLIPMIVRDMQQALPLKVPIVVETGMGQNWLDAH